jgi:hypothetical protein
VLRIDSKYIFRIFLFRKLFLVKLISAKIE